MFNIALCDFNHETVGVHTETMPLAIGILGAHLDYCFKEQLNLELFKFVNDYTDTIDKGSMLLRLKLSRLAVLFGVAIGACVPVYAHQESSRHASHRHQDTSRDQDIRARPDGP